MRFEKIIPAEQLRPYIKYFFISENESESTYKVLPSAGLVLGFQYSGQLAVVQGAGDQLLATAGITGLKNRFTLFKNKAATRTVLVYFSEVGLAHFTSTPAHQLYNQSLSLDTIFDNASVRETEERLAVAATDMERIRLVEKFLLAHLRETATDKLVVEAVKRIYDAKGAVRINELASSLFISQSPFEKRFRQLVGTSPKKFASLVRFNAVLQTLRGAKSLTDLGYENHFFDQAHFIHDFKQYAGQTPEQYKRFL